ncbi:MAG: photosystem I reaction center subunit PsaK [Coleofasciculus sp. C2-GNP5-27]
MLNISLFAAVQSSVPPTPSWTPTVGLVMIICNLVAIVVGYYAIQNPGVGPDLPLPKPAIFKRFGVTELLATASLGHLIGAGVILGLTNAGAL